jgi:hypothetical protein
MIAEHIKKERLVQKKERLVQLDKVARAFSTITHIADTLLVEEVKDILECVWQGDYLCVLWRTSFQGNNHILQH